MNEIERLDLIETARFDVSIPYLFDASKIQNWKLRDKVCVIFNQIKIIRSVIIGDDTLTEWYIDGYVPLNAAKLKKITNSYDVVLNYMLVNNLLQLWDSGSYTVGEISKRYRVNPDIIVDDKYFKWKKYTIKSRALIKSLTQRLLDDNKAKSKGPVYEYMFDILVKSHIDEDAAIKWLDVNYKSNSSKMDVVKTNVEMFNLKKRLNRDAFGRVHTNITNLKRELKQFITFIGLENEEYVVLDFANFQPWIISMLIDSNFVKMNKIVLDKYDLDFEYPSILHLFKNTCTAGILWKTLMYQAKENNVEISLKELKRKTLIYFYGKSYHADNKLKQLYTDLFPSLDAYISILKRKNYKDVAHMAQEVETHLMIDLFSTKMMNLNLKFLTVHDAFYCLKKDEDVVRNIVESEFKKFDVVCPKLRNG